MRSDRKAEYPEILEDEEDLILDFWIQIRLARRCKGKFNASSTKTFCIPLENHEHVRKGKGSRGRGREAREGVGKSEKGRR